MHFAPAGIPEGKSGEIIRSYLMDLREKTTLLQNETVTCRLPSPFHHGLIMLMHLQHHLLAEGIGLRHLCDWAVFVNRFVGSDFPDTFQKRLKAVGLWRFARLLSLSASLYIGLPEQAWMREEAGDEELAAALMRDLLNGGNFGAKNRQRGYEGMFISNRGKNGVQNNRCKELCSSVNRITKQKYPVMKKIPLLLPFGWLFTVVGYFFHNGKRKKKNSRVSMVEAYRNSEPRRQLYRQCHLYEPES
jgi:hypothetical protein